MSLQDSKLPEAGRSVSSVSPSQQAEVEDDAVLVAPPAPVTHENEGKHYLDTFNPKRPAPALGDASSPLLCGPILRYTHQSDGFSRWHGSALIVLNRQQNPILTLDSESGRRVEPVKLLEEKGRYFYRFDIDVEHGAEGRYINYSIHVEGTGLIERRFHITAKGEAFHILFHSCNGFSTGAADKAAGLALWNDVLRKHEDKPFHVMIGGGDQIYSDGVKAPGAPLEQWNALDNGRHRAGIKFTAPLREKVDQFYFTQHCDWFNTAPFRQAVAQIPSVNIWDDHDIIDGFGSYKDRWQKAPIFLGIGEIAWSWMCLFQQHINPNTIKDMDPENPSAANEDHPEYEDEPFYVIHPSIGPYIRHKGISQLMSFGPEIAFVGFDCRTERTQEVVCRPETYDKIFSRMEETVVAGQTKHLLVLLGVPIAYPRLTWLENAMSKPWLVTPLRLASKVFGGFSGIFNTFDGQVELLDDLQDHWACGLHKKERNQLIQRFYKFAEKKQVRITILSGDVHLAAVGRFYSKKSLQIHEEHDHRYIVNVISSAITNVPPPAAVAQVLNARNKVHHLDHETDENLMRMWNCSAHDNSDRHNETTYPARNYCTIQLGSKSTAPSTEIKDPAQGIIRAKKVRGTAVEDDLKRRNDGKGISNGTAGRHSLGIKIHIEVDSQDTQGVTKAYGFSIPKLSRK